MCVNAHPSYQNRTIIGICYFFLNNIFPGLLFILISLILLVRVYAKKTTSESRKCRKLAIELIFVLPLNILSLSLVEMEVYLIVVYVEKS